MNKKDRQIIFDKFGGKCYLCGDQLKPGWHADHLTPCRRKYKMLPGYWTETYFVNPKSVPDGYDNPQANHIDNLMPACASCNINKHSMDLEGFRSLVSGFMKHLNEVSTQYKIAKRYGLLRETGNTVTFYFETLKK